MLEQVETEGVPWPADPWGRSAGVGGGDGRRPGGTVAHALIVRKQPSGHGTGAWLEGSPAALNGRPDHRALKRGSHGRVFDSKAVDQLRQAGYWWSGWSRSWIVRRGGSRR